MMQYSETQKGRFYNVKIIFAADSIFWKNLRLPIA